MRTEVPCIEGFESEVACVRSKGFLWLILWMVDENGSRGDMGSAETDRAACDQVAGDVRSEGQLALATSEAKGREKGSFEAKEMEMGNCAVDIEGLGRDQCLLH